MGTGTQSDRRGRKGGAVGEWVTHLTLVDACVCSPRNNRKMQKIFPSKDISSVLICSISLFRVRTWVMGHNKDVNYK